MKNIITIIVSGNNDKVLYNTLKEHYAQVEWIDIILYADYNNENESDIYILVGDDIGEDNKPNGIVIDLSDSILVNMTDEYNDMSTIRKQLIDGIAAPLYKDILIGLDYTDIKSVIQDSDDIKASVINTKSTSDFNGLVDKLIAKANVNVNISDRKNVYFYVEGDIALMEVNELAKGLEERMGNGSNIAFTASYDSEKTGEYYVMVLFGI